MKPNSTWYASSQRIRISMMSVISGHVDIRKLRSPKEENHDHKILPIVITNNPNNPQIISKINKNL